MNAGRVLFFNKNQGYGYIGHNDGREVYFHYTSVQDPLLKKQIDSGAEVYFDVFETSIGWEASNIRASGF